MTEERKLEIENEAIRRVDLWLKNSSFNEMTVHGSRMRFSMGVGLIGYPFVKESWMGDDFNEFITEEEFNTNEYDEIIDKLFNKYYDENN